MISHIIGLTFISLALVGFGGVIGVTVSDDAAEKKVKLAYLIGYNRGARDQYNSSEKLWEQ